MYKWQHIYESFDPIAIKFFSLNIYWYGIMYVFALFSALYMAKFLVRKDNLNIKDKMLDNYFFWAELGVILGARLGYVFIYSGDLFFYLIHPWQIFNPFENGEFVGIRGMSYHGAVIGFMISSWFFCKKYKQNLWLYLDLCAVSIPFGYFFGRIGNFLNQELVGRITDLPWGIYVNGVLRHPSQIYEAILEGIFVFLILFSYRKFKKNDGELIALYAILYTIARFIVEFFRQPDEGLGFIIFNLSMGQILSLIMFCFGLILFLKRTKVKI